MSETGTARPRFGVGSLVRHPDYGVGRILAYEPGRYVIGFKGGETRHVAYGFEALVEVEAVEDADTSRVKQAVREVLQDYGWIETEWELGRRWAGGTVVLSPGKAGTQPKEIPLDMFFKKIIGVREKLRVLEQKINNHPALSAEDKLELEGYITRCYGSLTTFNVLFADKEQQFSGQGE